MPQPSRLRVLALAALVLAVVQTIESTKYLGDARYLSLLLFLAAFFGVAASVKLCLDNCFEARFTLAMIALSTVVGHVLSLTVGLPGSSMNAWSGTGVVLGFISLVAALSILVMLLPRLFLNFKQTGSRPPV